MAGIQQFVINMIIVLCSVLLIGWYRSVRIEVEIKRNLLIGIICSVTIVLCMFFSFQVLPGYLFDLRAIPLLIGIFYGGFLGGTLSALSLYVFRFYLGGDGVWNVLIVYTIITVLTFLMVPTYSEMNQVKKRLTSTSISLMTAILMMLNTNFREGLPQQEWFSILLYIFFHGITTWLSIYLIERVSYRFQIGNPKIWSKVEGTAISYSSNH